MKKLCTKVPDVSAGPKNIFPPVSCCKFLQNMAAPRVFVEVSDNGSENLWKEIESEMLQKKTKYDL